jgi:hypothetical protein
VQRSRHVFGHGRCRLLIPPVLLTVQGLRRRSRCLAVHCLTSSLGSHHPISLDLLKPQTLTLLWGTIGTNPLPHVTAVPPSPRTTAHTASAPSSVTRIVASDSDTDSGRQSDGKSPIEPQRRKEMRLNGPSRRGGVP